MTDEPRVEIEPCPMPGCGERCFVASSTHWGVGGNKRVVCAKCTYSSRDFELSADAIAAHNALCADVRRGRDAEKIETEQRHEIERLERVILDIKMETNRHIDLTNSNLDTLKIAIAQLMARHDALRAEVARPRAIKAAASEVSENALDMGPYYQARVEEIDALRAALDAGQDQ